MTHTYLPQPYCDFDEMRRRVYYHFYPDIQGDTELRGVVQSNVEPASEAAAKQRQQLCDMDLDPDSMTNWQSVSMIQKSAGQKLSKEAKSVFEAGIDARRLLSISDEIEKGCFDPVIQFFPQWSQVLRKYITPSVPNALKPIQDRRLQAFMDTARDGLYRGRISVHHKSSEGILKVQDKNIWLDDWIATMALETGQLTHNLKKSRTNLGTVDMIFDGDELSERFPPLSNRDAADGSTKKTMPEKIADALIMLHPDGIPAAAYGEIGDLRHQVESLTGIDALTDATWQRGKNLYQRRLNDT
ncbi:MAG: hypothetical protein AB3N07_06835 [Ruegeria sp.]